MKQSELVSAFALANEFKEGDLLVGGTRDDRARRDAKAFIAELSCEQIRRCRFVDDQVTEVLSRSLDAEILSRLSRLTIGRIKERLVGPQAPAWVSRHRDGLSSEVIAAVVKIMTNEELETAAGLLFNPHPGDGITIGSPRHFGSRIQPNSPGDSEEEILFSTLEGLTYGCGDVILGLNPASDDLDTIVRLEALLKTIVDRLRLPTRYCVLSDIVKQNAARARVSVDVGFQSLAGTSKALQGMVGLDVDGILDLAGAFPGLYFETGQGAEITNGTAEGIDMVTLESRTYGVARFIQRRTGRWMVVNDVAGFIGPEVFRTTEQLYRTCLEDTVMGKLHGLTMGLDVCATFHMGISPADLEAVTERVVAKVRPGYLMAVAGNADPMLGYLTTSFREHPGLRAKSNRHLTTGMAKRLRALGIPTAPEQGSRTRTGAASLFARYMKAGGETRSSDALERQAERALASLRERGCDLGYGDARGFTAPADVRARMDAIYAHARAALYASLDQARLAKLSEQCVRVSTTSTSRDEYLSHPATGETISDEDSRRLMSLYRGRGPRIQIVISDGLNADAVNDNLGKVLPPLKRVLKAGRFSPGSTEIVVTNGRVRAGYHVGRLVGADAVIHFIGERPGTGLNTLSAYLTYGLDSEGHRRWDRIGHSDTTAICGINSKAKPPRAAVEEIRTCVARMFTHRRSGVCLGSIAE